MEWGFRWLFGYGYGFGVGVCPFAFWIRNSWYQTFERLRNDHLEKQHPNHHWRNT